MAILIKDGRQCEVKKGEKIIKPCESMDLLFGCKEGLCEVCKIKVISGSEHLNDITDNEKEMGVEAPFRLACQCVILSDGEISITQDNKI